MTLRFPRPILLLACLGGMAGLHAAEPPGHPPAAAVTFTLTDAEKAWIRAHPVIRVVTLDDFAPYIFAGPDGRLTGLTVNLIDLLAARTGLRFEYQTHRSVSSALTAFKAGQGDLLPAVVRNPEREQFLLFSRPYSTAFSVIVTRTDSPYLNGLPELNGLRVGTLHGAVQNEIIRAGAPQAKLVEYTTVQESLIALAAGQVDATYAGVATAAYYIKSLQLANLRLGSVVGQSVNLHIGVRRDWPLLAELIDKSLADITPAERQSLDDHWIFVAQAPNRWLPVLKIAAVVGAVAIGVSLFLLYFYRRLARELVARRRVQAELEQAHAELARASTEKSAMMSSIAHDLRNPITGIMLSGELLQSLVEPGNREAHETLAAQHNACRKILSMVDELVSKHMLETGRREFHLESVDLVALVREAIADVAKVAQGKGIRLEFTAEEGAQWLRSDERALRHVIDNLVSNALKYSPPRSTVTLEVQPRPGGCLLRVLDQGPGVLPEERELIFERMARGSARPTGGEKSTGLGLWIVRRTLVELNGRVWCEPRPDSPGAAFCVFLPRAEPPA